MTTLSELKRICHSSIQPNYSWWLQNISRKISLPLTALAIKTKITPNQITWFSLLIGFVMVAFLKGSATAILLGALLFQIFYIVDCVDGEVARYKAYSNKNMVITDKISINQTGLFFDAVVHYILIPSIFFFLALGQYRIIGSLYIIILGFAAGISVLFIGLIEDCKAKCVLESIKKGKGIITSSEKSNFIEAKAAHSQTILKSIFSALHRSCFFYNIMNIIGAVAILNFVVPLKLSFGKTEFNWVVLFLFYYAFAAFTIWSFKLIKIIAKDNVSQEVIETSNFLREKLGRKNS